MSGEDDSNDARTLGTLNRRRFVQTTGVVAAGVLGGNVTSAQTDDEPGRWSDPATWGGQLPQQGDRVTIEEGDHVVLDTSPPQLDGVLVEGTLEFEDAPGDGGDGGGGGGGDDGGGDGGGGGDGDDGGGGGDPGQDPFGGPHAVPGVVQAENFDTGGNGTGYNDVDDGSIYGDDYRDTDVEVANAEVGGQTIGVIRDGEWWEYTVEVETAGTYEFTALVSAPDSGAFHVEVDGETVIDSTEVATGTRENYQTVTAGELELDAGTHVLRVVSDDAGWSFNRFTLDLANTSASEHAPRAERAANLSGDADACAPRYREVTYKNPYRSGDVVAYDGANWEAQWYTLNPPGEADGAWEKIGECSLVSDDADGAPVDVELTTTWLLADGSNALVRIGYEDDPYQRDARIRLVGHGPENVRGDDEMAIGTKFLGTWDGGSIEIHGASRDKTDWTQLDAHADAGASTLTLTDAVDWEAGDEIAIAPSGADPWQAERRTVDSVDGTQVTVSESLDHDHYGAIETHRGKELDMRAEVGLLSRNVELRGGALSYYDDDMSPDSKYATGFGGHGIFADPGRVRIEGMEAFRCGQTGFQARYPLHFHHGHDQSESYIKHNSVWHSLQRGINCHGTGNVQIESNVVFDTVGHSFLVEEGLESEDGNVFTDNLAMLTKNVKEPDRAFGGYLANPGDVTRRPKAQNGYRPAAFWLSNPNQELVGNHAAGGYGAMGFFYDGHNETDAELDASEFDVQFRDNVAHSYSIRPQKLVDGYHSDVSHDDILGSWRISHYQHICQGVGLMLQLHPMTIDPDELPDRTDRIEGFTAYKCEHSGIWTEFETSVVEDSVVADFNIGHFALGGSETRDSVFVGRNGTDNDVAPPPTQFKTGGGPLQSPALHDATNGGRYAKTEPTEENVEFVDVDLRHNARLSPSARTTDE
jgi:hypothetical protein